MANILLDCIVRSLGRFNHHDFDCYHCNHHDYYHFYNGVSGIVVAVGGFSPTLFPHSKRNSFGRYKFPSRRYGKSFKYRHRTACSKLHFHRCGQGSQRSKVIRFNQANFTILRHASCRMRGVFVF